MDPSLVMNLAALGISLAALVLSVVLTRRQMSIATGGTVVSVVVNVLKELRQPEYLEARNYVLNHLAEENSPEAGINQLPAEVRDRVIRVGGLFEDFGKLVAFRVIDERIVVASIGVTVLLVWESLKPYIYKQREISGNQQYWVFLEDLAYRCTVRPASKVRSDLGLKKFAADMPIEASRNLQVVNKMAIDPLVEEGRSSVPLGEQSKSVSKDKSS